MRPRRIERSGSRSSALRRAVRRSWGRQWSVGIRVEDRKSHEPEEIYRLCPRWFDDTDLVCYKSVIFVEVTTDES